MECSLPSNNLFNGETVFYADDQLLSGVCVLSGIASGFTCVGACWCKQVAPITFVKRFVLGC